MAARALAYASMTIFVSVILMYPFFSGFGSWCAAAVLFMRTAPVLPLAR